MRSTVGSIAFIVMIIGFSGVCGITLSGTDAPRLLLLTIAVTVASICVLGITARSISTSAVRRAHARGECPDCKRHSDL